MPREGDKIELRMHGSIDFAGATVRKLALFSGTLLLVGAIGAGLWLTNAQEVGHSSVSRRSAAATANPHATQAALEILRNGGSAVDATISAQLALTLVEPQSSGIGGGLFLLVSDARGHMRVFDGRETAPLSARPDMFLQQNGQPRAPDEIAIGGLAVGVPGVIAALELAHTRYGKLPWRDLFAPAIRLAEHGFAVSPLLAQAIAELDRAKLDPAMQNAYFHQDGSPFRTGDIIRDLQLAATLRKIAREGRNGFYEGETAQAIVAAVRDSPHNASTLTLSDLRGYRAVEREPICSAFLSYRVCTTPAPSGGVSVLQILGFLTGQSPSSLALGSLSQVHLVSQAERLAYADRAKWMADPAFATVPSAGLLNSVYLRLRASLVHPTNDMGFIEAGSPPPAGAMLIDYAPHRTPTRHGTSHVVIVDQWGTIVSMTSSVQAAFGAQIRAAGFVLNNELTDFSLEPAVLGKPIANAPAPGKRPLSAMSPAIVFDPEGRFFAAVGSPGGPEIITYNAQALVNLIAARATMAATVSASHYANLNGPTVLERGTRLIALVPWLLLRNHSIRLRKLESGLSGIRKSPAGYEAATDTRGEGLAAGE